MQPVAADQGEEGRQKGAALRSGALAIMPTNSWSSRPRKPARARRSPPSRRRTSARDAPARRWRPAAGEAREQEAGSLERDVGEVEQVLAARAASGLVGQHGVGGEERREHHDVAEQEDPEAVADEDPLRGRDRSASSWGTRGRGPRAFSAAMADAGVRGESFGGLQPERALRRARARLRGRSRDLLGRNRIGAVAPGEDDEGGEGADEGESRPATRYARSARSHRRWRRTRRRSRSRCCSAARCPV